MKRLHYALTLLLLAVTAPCACAQGGKGQQFAFLVACSKYDVTELKPLPYSVAEMSDFRAALIKTGFAPDNIKFLRDRQLKEDEYRFLPERSKILREFKLLLERVGKEDTLLVALNGHGLQFKGERTGYYCPLDARVTDKSSLIPLDSEGGLFEMLQKSGAKRKLLIVNACRNDPTNNLALAASKVELDDGYNEEVPPGIAALYSCQKGQRSYYYDEKDERTKGRQRSLFFHHLIESWNGRYVEQGQKVTLEHVFNTVCRKTAADADSFFGQPQVPQPKRLYEGEWVVAIPLPPKEMPDTTPAAERIYTQVTGNLLEQILRKLDVQFQKKDYGDGEAMYSFTLNGRAMRLWNYAGRDLMADANFDKVVNAAALNQYNVDRKFIRAVAYNPKGKNAYTSLESNLDCVGGVTEEIIRAFIVNFPSDVAHFGEYIAKLPTEVNPPPAAAAKLYQTISDDQIEQILGGLNLRYKKNIVSKTQTTFDFKLEGFELRLYNYGGKDLMIDAIFRKTPLARINHWNNSRKFVRAVAYNLNAANEYASLEANFECTPGVSEDMVRFFITIFPVECKAFDEFLTK
jgi:hypothetical protein